MKVKRNSRAGFYATVMTGVFGLLFLIPVVNVFAFIALMLALWPVDSLGILDIGKEQNGFFVPTALGFCLGAVIFWTLCFLFLRLLFTQRNARYDGKLQS
jgi:hypothetical protein